MKKLRTNPELKKWSIEIQITNSGEFDPGEYCST